MRGAGAGRSIEQATRRDFKIMAVVVASSRIESEWYSWR
jgi:hypothetical protein